MKTNRTPTYRVPSARIATFIVATALAAIACSSSPQISDVPVEDTLVAQPAQQPPTPASASDAASATTVAPKALPATPSTAPTTTAAAAPVATPVDSGDPPAPDPTVPAPPTPDPTVPDPTVPPTPPAPDPTVPTTPNAAQIATLSPTATNAGVILMNSCNVQPSDEARHDVSTWAYDAMGDGSADDVAIVFRRGDNWIIELQVAGGPLSQAVAGPANSWVHTAIGSVRLDADTRRHVAVRAVDPSIGYSWVSFFGVDTDGCLLPDATASYMNGFTGTVWHSIMCTLGDNPAAYVTFEEVPNADTYRTQRFPIRSDGSLGVDESWTADLLPGNTMVQSRGANLCTGLQP